MQYIFVKNMHMTFAVITVLLFNIRFLLLVKNPHKPLEGIWKVLPHLNDTMLLFAGLWLMKITHFTPFGNANWLGVKILLLLAYIALGAMMMRSRPRSVKFFSTYALAMVCVASIVYMAFYKPF